MGVPYQNMFYLMSISLIFILLIPNATNAENILNIKSTQYTNFSQKDEYISSSAYTSKGMGPLYNITNNVIKLFVSEEPIPEDYIIIKDRTFQPGPKVKEGEWGDLLKQYWAILLVVIVCVLLIVLMPLIGLCLCCCRCFGSCGGRSQPFDKKHDTCKRVLLGLLLISAASALVFGVVIAFVTNSYMQQGIENATTSARYGVDDTRTFLKSTSFHISYLLVNNYDELNKQLSVTLDETAEIVVKRLEEESKAVSLNKLYDFVDKLPEISQNLSRMTTLTNELRVNASQLNDGLRGVKRELLGSLTKCGTQECITVLDDYKIGKLDTNGIDYNQLPDLASLIQNVGDIVDGQLGNAVKNGVTELDHMKRKLQRTVSENIPKVKAAADSTGKAIKGASNEISSKLNNVADLIGNNTYKHLATADEYVAQYSIYRYYAGLGVSSVLLLILLCVVFGLLCGICGKRPDGYGDDCCNKGAGGRFLMIAVAFIFLTFSVLLAVTLVSFLAGAVAKRGVCDSMDKPGHSQVFEYVDEFVDLNNIYEEIRKRNRNSKLLSSTISEPLKVSDIIIACHKNKTIYEVLRLENFFDIQEIRNYPEKYGIQRELDALLKNIEINGDIRILSAEAESEIIQLANSELNDFAAYKFSDNLTENITQYDLSIIASKLRAVAQQIPPGKEMNEIKVSLKNQALHLNTYQTNLVDPMKKSTKELLELSRSLESSLRFGETSFKAAIDNFLREIKLAEHYIQKNGTRFVRQLAKELTEGFLQHIHDYLNLVIDETRGNIGKCGPLSNVYDSMVVAACNRVVDPFNGFWAGIAWCLVIFIPTIILCVKLSTLYQKSDPYPGPLVESEYLYDAYSERDNIPLANGPKNKRRNKKQDRRRESRDRDRRGDYYEDTSPTPGSHRDARYTDMAPKNWDGAPPRYQNPPMAPPAAEYERPPPYYFPGAPSEE